MGPQADKAWATGKGTRKARTDPVPMSKVRNTMMVIILAEMFTTLPEPDGKSSRCKYLAGV